MKDGALVVGHEEEDLEDALAGVADGRVDVADDVLVAVERRDDLDLAPARRQVGLVVDVHPFQRVAAAVRRPHQEHDGETSCEIDSIQLKVAMNGRHR